MASFKNLIATLSQQTAKYISRNDIFYLDAFISGWICCHIENITDLYLIGNFQEWIIKKFNVKHSQSRIGTILFYSVDETQAVKYFFELFNEFLEETETE